MTLVHIIYGIPITTLIFRNYFANIPTELIEAARIDGAGLIKIFWQIMLPLELAGLRRRRHLPVHEYLERLPLRRDRRFLPGRSTGYGRPEQPQGHQSVDWTVVMAGAAISALPTMMIYVLLGKFFIRGLLAGSMKG